MGEFLPPLLRGAVVTIELTAAITVVAVACAFAAALSRRSRWRAVRTASLVYVEVFRGTSALVQLFFAFFVLPLWGIRLGPFHAAVLALGLNFGAYGSEVVRAALANVPAGQYEAAAALNLPRLTTMRRIVLPQAVPMMLPPFGNQMIEIMKATSLASTITVTELTFAGKRLVQSSGQFSNIYLEIFLIYLGMAIPLVIAVRLLERALRNGPNLRGLREI